MKIKTTMRMEQRGFAWMQYLVLTIDISPVLNLQLYKPISTEAYKDSTGIGKEKIRYKLVDRSKKHHTRWITDNLTNASEEELFQLETVWEHSIDLYLLRTIQVYYYDNNFPGKNTEPWRQEWEY